MIAEGLNPEAAPPIGRTECADLQIPFSGRLSMLEEHKTGSVWNVALIAVVVFVAVMALAGVLSPGEVTAVSAKL